MSLTVVLPKRVMDALSDQLVGLTEAIDNLDPERVAHGFLGGRHGYGGEWDTPVFQMRPFCWCEGDDCPWCMGCDCSPGSLHHFVDGVEVSSQEWSAFYDRETYIKLSGGKVRNWQDDLNTRYFSGRERHAKLMEAAEAANARRSIRHDPDCAYCRGERFVEKGAVAGRGAPNFWHKPSGLKVWWYKYIGRSQEVVGPENPDIAAIFADCLADVARANTSPPMTGGRGAEPPCSSGSTGDEMNPSPRDEKWKS